MRAQRCDLSYFLLFICSYSSGPGQARNMERVLEQDVVPVDKLQLVVARMKKFHSWVSPRILKHGVDPIHGVILFL